MKPTDRSRPAGGGGGSPPLSAAVLLVAGCCLLAAVACLPGDPLPTWVTDTPGPPGPPTATPSPAPDDTPPATPSPLPTVLFTPTQIVSLQCPQTHTASDGHAVCLAGVRMRTGEFSGETGLWTRVTYVPGEVLPIDLTLSGHGRCVLRDSPGANWVSCNDVFYLDLEQAR